jgi:feruloyl esterase
MKFSLFLLAALPLAAATCDSLNSLKVPNATIRATLVAAGAYQAPVAANAKGKAPAADYSTLPAFCDVMVVSKPGSGSTVNIEYWLPETNWNGGMIVTGNGGLGGSINNGGGSARGATPFVRNMSEGYVAAMSDTGHTGGNGAFLLNSDAMLDFAYRAVHDTADIGKKLAQARYESPVRRSYFAGCAGGGRQALKAAQMYPADFDGVLAGSPAAYTIGRAAQAIWIGQATHKTAESALPAAKFAVIHDAVIAACDVLDGVKDGVLENPRKCNFDPKSIQCAGADAPTCLTAAQVETTRAIYADVKNPRSGEVYFPGHEPGSENGWNTMAGANPFGVGLEVFRNAAFAGDASWDYKTLNFDADMAKAMKGAGAIDATDPNLKAYFDRGGKIIQYHGWNDPQISPRSSVMYYDNVVKANGGLAKVQQNHRLFMVPGMAHCGGGDGTSTFDGFTALTQWVEQNKTPVTIAASKVADGKTIRTRPLCSYPATAQYKGTGSTDDASNFVCQ